MLIYEDNAILTMTLIVAVHNGKDIVVGSDTLTKVKIDGVAQPDEEREKIHQPNSKCAILVAGDMSNKTVQFIGDFTYHSKEVTDANLLRDALLQAVGQLLHPGPLERFQFIVAGFHETLPAVHRIMFKPDEGVKSGTLRDNIYTSGFEGPARRAMELLNIEHESSMGAGKLKKYTKEVIQKCIDEFKDAGEERIGGKPDTRILYRD